MQINKDLLNFFEHLLGPSKQQNNGNFAFKCPQKNHRKSKLIINLDTPYYNCFACQNLKGRSYYTLLKKINADKSKFEQLSEILKDDINLNTIEISENKIDELKLPSEFWPFSKKNKSFEYKDALNYLTKIRKIPLEKIYKYNLGYCENGPYFQRIIIPSYDKNGNLNYFTGRSYTKNLYIKYKNPKISRTDIIPFELYISWNIPIILVEGFFDAISIDYNAIPLLTKTISNKLLLKLVEHQVQYIYLMLDGDAIKDYIRLIKLLKSYDIETKPIFLKNNEDPSDLSQKEIFIKCKNSKIFNNAELLKLKLRL